MMEKVNIAVLIGRGGRLPAILKCVETLPNAHIGLVITYKMESAGVELAQGRGIEALPLGWKAWKDDGRAREEYCKELSRILEARGIDLVVMAGWNVVLTKEYFEGFSGKTMNIHPALLPSFAGLYGRGVFEKIFESGVKITGATLHFVIDEGVDTGPIILQEAVSVEDHDTIESLQTKVHAKEEYILCRGIKLFCEGRLRIEGKRVFIQ